MVGNNISLAFVSDKIQSVFNKLKEGGSVGTDLQETFWSKYYDMVTDKFGVNWKLNLGFDDV